MTQEGHLWYNHDPAPCLCIFHGFVSVNDECWHAQLFSHVQLFVTRLLCPWNIFRQEYWRGLPLPTPDYLPNPGIKTPFPVSPALVGGFFTTEPSRSI